MSRVLVTGAKGLVGVWTVQKLLSNGHGVVGVDLTRPAESVIPKNMRFMTADVTDFGELSQVVLQTEPDVIVHLAAVPHAGIEPAFKTFRTNVMGAFNVFEAAQRTETDVVWTSSVEIHGDPVANFEQHSVPFDEELPNNPPNAYGLSKQVGERLAEFYASTNGHSIATVRPAWINEPGRYGTRSVREWFNPEQVAADHEVNAYYWSYIDVRDLADLIQRLVTVDIAGHERFFAVAEDTYLDLETAAALEAVFDIEVPADAVPEYSAVYSTAKATAQTDWEPTYSWREEETRDDPIEPLYR